MCVDRGDAVGIFAGGDEFGNDLGAHAAGEGGLAEAAVGIEHDRDVAAQGEQPLGDVAVGEVDLLDECRRGVGELRVPSRPRMTMLSQGRARRCCWTSRASSLPEV